MTTRARRPPPRKVAANIQVTNIARFAGPGAAWHLACTVLPALLEPWTDRWYKRSPLTYFLVVLPVSFVVGNVLLYAIILPLIAAAVGAPRRTALGPRAGLDLSVPVLLN